MSNFQIITAMVARSGQPHYPRHTRQIAALRMTLNAAFFQDSIGNKVAAEFLRSIARQQQVSA